MAAWRTRQAEVVQPRQLPDGLLDVRRRGEARVHPYIVEIETYADPKTAEALLDDVLASVQVELA